MLTAVQLSSNLSSTLGLHGASFFSFSQTFANLLGSNPVIQTLAERDYEFAHEGPVWLPKSDEVTVCRHARFRYWKCIWLLINELQTAGILRVGQARQHIHS